MTPPDPTDVALRDRVHAELTALLGSHGPLEDPTGLPARQRPAFVLRATVLQDLARRIHAARSGFTHGGRMALLTAGPPGAGKSTYVDQIPHLDTYRRIDSDQIKSHLVDLLDDAGTLAVLDHHGPLADGLPVLPYEVSHWVHRASTVVQDLVVDMALTRHENFIIEGTLDWDGLVERYGLMLADREYEVLDIIDVEVTRDDAIENVRQRWWRARCTEPLGGRFMTDDAVGWYFRSDPTDCSVNATALFDEAVALGMPTVRHERIDRATDGSARHRVMAVVDGHAHKMKTWTTPVDPPGP